MNYSNHSLRADLQEWKNRLYRAPYSQFGYQLKFLLNNLKTNKQLSGIIAEIILKHKQTDELIDRIIEQSMGRIDIEFDNEQHQAAFCYQFLNYFIQKYKTYDLHHYTTFQHGDFNDTANGIIEDFISPIIYYLHDRLDKSTAIIYLLEKYKRRTEWFTKKELYNKYASADKGYEQILEDDLRLFLFEQGIDYPFSTPSSSSGRADIIGEIETDDPLVIEIKIFDREKNYGKDRIKDGFSQIVQYTNDYNKDVGYLVIFNMDNAELNFNFEKNDKIFPPKIIFNNKTFYFVVINSSVNPSASKIGSIKEVEVTEEELTKK